MAQPELSVPFERALHHMVTLREARGLFLLLCFCAHYVTWQSKRMDAFYGSQTLGWYQAALASATLRPFWTLDTIASVKAFVEDHHQVTWELQGRCPLCEVAVLSTLQDMRGLGLDQGTAFLCSDFNKFVGEDDYDTRNCSETKQEWDKSDWNASLRRNPPCCRREGIGSLDGYTQELYSEVVVPLEQTGSMEMQVVVSRGQRMLGVLYSAALVNEYAPSDVVTKVEFWTYNYSDVENDYDTPKWWGLALLTLVFMHEVFEVLSNGQGVRGTLASLASPYFFLVEVPSLISPVLAEILKPHIELKLWALWVTLNEYILLVRLFEEGQVVPALRLVVQARACSSVFSAPCRVRGASKLPRRARTLSVRCWTIDGGAHALSLTDSQDCDARHCQAGRRHRAAPAALDSGAHAGWWLSVMATPVLLGIRSISAALLLPSGCAPHLPLPSDCVPFLPLPPASYCSAI